MKKITVLGGGTGSFVVLSGLKTYEYSLGAIVTMMDSGGSTGRLRDQLGVLPPGDLRQCLVALSEAPELWRKLFLYRFENGDLAGHNFGNIFLSALEKVSSNYDEVIDTVSYVLQTKGTVLPVTYKNTHMCVQYESGAVVKGEGNIDENHSEKSRVVKAYLEPEVDANAKALETLKESDYLIICPGDIYASIIPVLLAGNVKSTIQESHAKIIYVMNLMTKSGQTTKYTASDHIRDLTNYCGRAPDMVVINNGEIPEDILQWYRDNDEQLVVNDLVESGYSGKIVQGDLIDRHKVVKSNADVLVRSILRHDSEKLAILLNDLFL